MVDDLSGIGQLRESDLEPPNPLAAMMSNPDEAAAEPSIQMTHVEFDMKKWNDEAKRLAMQACVVAGVHWKWQYLIPIIISPTMVCYRSFLHMEELHLV